MNGFGTERSSKRSNDHLFPIQVLVERVVLLENDGWVSV